MSETYQENLIMFLQQAGYSMTTLPQSIAKAFKIKYEYHKEAYKILESITEKKF